MGNYFCQRTAFLSLLFLSSIGLSLNGMRPIGVSSVSRSLGGTGVANQSNAFDAIYKNPALLGGLPLEIGNLTVTTGLTFGQFIGKTRATYGEDRTYKYPKGPNKGVFPSGLGLGFRLSEKISLGFGFLGGGGGVDYGEEKIVLGARSKTLAFTILPALSYKLSDSSFVGVGLAISQVSTYASTYKPPLNLVRSPPTKGKGYTGGISIGFYNRYSEVLDFGASFQPKQTAKLPKARNLDIDDDDKDDVLFTATPLEAAIGVTYKPSLWFKMNLDYRFLQWSDAYFLRELGWRDQHVYAIGAELGEGDHVLRLGYNFGESPVKNIYYEEAFATDNFQGHSLYKVAISGIAAVSGLGLTSSHWTLGTGHALTEMFRIDTGLVYFAEGEITRQGVQTPGAARGYQDPYGWKNKFSATTLNVEFTYRL